MFCDWLGLDSPAIFRQILSVVYGSSSQPATRADVDEGSRLEMFNGVQVRVFSPVTSAGAATTGQGYRPGVVMFHGGGWTIGSIGTYTTLTAHSPASVSSCSRSCTCTFHLYEGLFTNIHEEALTLSRQLNGVVVTVQ